MNKFVVATIVASAVAVAGCTTFEDDYYYGRNNCHNYSSEGMARGANGQYYYSRECDRRYHHDGWGN